MRDPGCGDILYRAGSKTDGRDFGLLRDEVIEDKVRIQPMTHPWVILQHVAWEGPGLIASEAASRGLPTDIRRLDLGGQHASGDRGGRVGRDGRADGRL